MFSIFSFFFLPFQSRQCEIFGNVTHLARDKFSSLHNNSIDFGYFEKLIFVVVATTTTTTTTTTRNPVQYTRVSVRYIYFGRLMFTRCCSSSGRPWQSFVWSRSRVARRIYYVSLSTATSAIATTTNARHWGFRERWPSTDFRRFRRTSTAATAARRHVTQTFRARGNNDASHARRSRPVVRIRVKTYVRLTVKYRK